MPTFPTKTGATKISYWIRRHVVTHKKLYLERGMRHPSQKVVEKLSNALKLDSQDLYLLANPRVRTLLGKEKPVAPSASPWQKFIRNASVQQKNGLSKVERDALAQIVKAERSTSLSGVMKAVRALRKGFKG